MDTDSSSLSDESMEESGESVDLSDESMEESAESVDKEDTVAENLEYPLQTDDAHVDEDEFTELAVVESVESVESVEEDSDETTVEVEEPYSPFEAEPEPIAGVFRLKAKESFETQLQADESNSDDSPGVDASADGESPWLTESPSRQMELPLAESEGDESGIPAAAAIPAGSVESDGSEEER